MRNFLERLVARATGEAAIRPRSVARFELGPWHDPVHPVAQADDVAPATATRPSPPAASFDPPLPAASKRAVAAPARPVSPSPRVAPERTDWPGPFVPRAPSAAEHARSRGAESERAGARAALSPAIVPKPLLPVAETRPTSPAARPAPVRSASRATPDVVQVRIGRIDVRAVIGRQDAPAAKPARAPRPQPLALEAFLEGKRHP
jgi:hypothetical protein